MLRNRWNWFRGVMKTIVICLRYPELYRALCDHEFDEDDYTEVHEP